MLYASSCSVARNIGRENQPAPQPHNKPEWTEEEKVKTDPKADEKNINRERKSGLSKVKYQGKTFMVPPRKETYDMALILPFQIGFVSELAQKRAAYMYEYYSGARLALEELEQEGLKLNLHVFDNQNDTVKLRELINSGKLKSMDLIVGPIQNDHMQLMADYALQQQVALFSPLTAVDSLSTPNQWFYNNVPGNRMKARALIRVLKKQHGHQTLTIVRDDSRFDNSFTPVLIEELRKENFPYTVAEGAKWVKWDDYLTEKGLPVFIATDQQNNLSVILGKLFAHGKEPIVYGDQRWLSFTNNDFSFWEKLKVHVLSSSGQYEEREAIDDIRMKYIQKFNVPPGELSLLGYDQFRFFGEALMAFGQHFPVFISDHNLNYAFTSYRFVPMGNCMQNDNARVYRYINSKLQAVEL